MDTKKKRTLIIVGIIEAIILVFSLVVSIITLTNQVDPNNLPAGFTDANAARIAKSGPFIGALQNSSVLFFCVVVLPLLIIFLVDLIYLILYASKRQSSIGDAEKAAIEEQARKEAREELMKEMAAKSETPAATKVDPQSDKKD